jgi:hypothetical protein
MTPVRFEPTISAGEQPKIYALDRAATGTGGGILVLFIYIRRLASNEMFSPTNKIHREVGRAKDLSAPQYKHERALQSNCNAVYGIVKCDGPL